jgi:hypothetical protein
MKWLLLISLLILQGCTLIHMHEDREACLEGNENACQMYAIESGEVQDAAALSASQGAFLLTPYQNRYGLGAP